MRVTGLKLTNVRAIESAEFRFQPGLNLIVGVNGVGKSTVLDALRICMSRILPSITKSRAKAMSFSVDDIRRGFPFLDVELLFEHNKRDFCFTRRQWSQSFAADDTQNIDRLKREILNSNRLRGRARNLLRELDTSHGVADTDNFLPSHAALKKSASESRVGPTAFTSLLIALLLPMLSPRNQRQRVRQRQRMRVVLPLVLFTWLNSLIGYVCKVRLSANTEWQLDM